MGNATPGPVVTGKNGVSRSFARGNQKKIRLKPAEAVLLCHKTCPIISYLFSYVCPIFWWLRSYCCPIFQFWGHSRYATIEAHNAKSFTLLLP